MKFNQTKISGCFLVELDLKMDERGFFARSYCDNEFKNQGLQRKWVQMSNSYNTKAGTIRGLHLQRNPFEEVKIVRCISGKIWDLIVDLRQESDTFGQWFGEILSGQNRKMMYIDKGVAHGFITLENNTEIIYSMSEFYSKEHELTIKWDDPKLNIKWPSAPLIISDKDNAGLDFDCAMNILNSSA